MKKQPEKLKPWSRKDYVKISIATVVNILVIIGIVMMTIYLNGYGLGAVENGWKSYFSTSLNQFIYLCLTIVVLMGVLIAYLYIEHRDFSKETANIVMIFVIFEFSVLCSYFAGRYVSIYFRPLAMLPLLLLLLSNKRIALFSDFVFCLLMFLIDTFTNANFNYSAHAQYSSLILGFVAGVIGVFLIDKVYSRWKVLFRGVFIMLPLVVGLLLLEQADLFKHWERLLAVASSGVVSVALFVLFLPVFEFIFKKVTSYKLAELTDHRSPLIRKMIDVAPGTFNHSIVVSNLAEACATAIGEDALLARCAAYYHDMGKLRQPEFFKENQMGGENPHDDITPELSANIIKAHAKDGYELLRKHRLPQSLADICLQHHGTMPILYFYAKAKKYTDADVSIETFSYNGPKPQTKVAAIMMITDSCEAAVRTMKDRSREKVDKTIEKIINDRLVLGQFDECEITMKELNIIRNSIVNNLTGIYHKRIEYPKVNIEKLKAEEE